MKMTIKLKGTEKVLANLKKWNDILEREMGNALNITRLKVEDSARRMAPKDTGALKASIWSRMTGPLEAQIGDGVYYGIFQELGTSRNRAQPFMRPAFEAEKGTFINHMKRVLR